MFDIYFLPAKEIQKKTKKNKQQYGMFLTLGVDFLLILYHWSSQKITSGKILK